MFPGSLVFDYIVAPFWNNGSSKNVSYEVHSISSNPKMLSQVSRFIRQENENSFAGTWMLLTEWNYVNGLISRFQGILITNGYQSFCVFTYKCGLLQSETKDAVIGFRADDQLFTSHSLSGSEASSIACQNSPLSDWSNVIYQLHLHQLRFLTLEDIVQLPAVDDGVSESIGIPNGFKFGHSTQASVYVSTNGLFSFGRPFPYHEPLAFPAASYYDTLVAPFWADADISGVNGQVFYSVHNNSDVALNWVSTFISQQQEIMFLGSWMLVAQWKDVPQHLGASGATDLMNTFQGILITDGNHSFAIFTYHCKVLQWSGGASIGFNYNSAYYKNHFLSLSTAANNISCLNFPVSNWTSVIYVLGRDLLSFFDIGATASVTPSILPQLLDASSSGVNILGGFAIGSTTQSQVYISSNGLLSFERSFTSHTPVRFSTSDTYRYLVAPFWDDHDNRPLGQVSYEVHSAQTPLVEEVSYFLTQKMDTYFLATWMVLAEWNDVPPFGLTTTTNTYQAIIISNNIKSYAIFIYKCGAITWGDSATIGFNAGGTFFQNHPFSLAGRSMDIACVNNGTSVWFNLIYQLTPEEQPYILFVQYSNYVRKVNLDGSQLQTVYTGGRPYALDYDYRRKYMFWSDDNSNTIYRARLDGSQSTLLINSGISCPLGLAWDWVNEKLYWTDYCGNYIAFYDPASGDRKNLINTGSSTDPRDIVVDPGTG
jgi:hypothetical protein